MVRGEVITLNANIRKEEKYQIVNLSSYLKNLEKGQNKSKASGRKEVI